MATRAIALVQVVDEVKNGLEPFLFNKVTTVSCFDVFFLLFLKVICYLYSVGCSYIFRDRVALSTSG